MTIRRANTIIRAAAVTAIAVGLLVLVVSIAAPVEDFAAKPLEVSSGQSAVKLASDLPPLEQFVSVFEAPLRGSPASATTQPAFASSGGVTLVGTIGGDIALVRSGDQTEVRLVGERIDGAELIAVRSGEIDMRTSGGVVTLRKPAEAADPDFIHNERQP